MAVVAAANLLFVLASLAVGARMLHLAARTRRAPELLLGLGLAGFGLGMPLLAASGIGRVAVAGLTLPPLVAGFCVLWVGITCLCAFTWKTFRPASAWALGLVWAAALCEAVIVAGATRAILRADPETASNLAAGFWIVAIRLPLLGAFAWGAIESIGQFRMARRRQAIGLGDAVVANRFLLWSIATVLTTFTNAASAALQAHGMGPLSSPIGATVAGLGGSTAAVLMCLVFMPPDAYLAMIRRRATRSS